MAELEKSLNGKGSKKNILGIPKDEEIKFPVSYHLKVVMEDPDDEAKHLETLMEIFQKLDIKFNFHDKKLSSKGNYVSYTYYITLENKSQMDKLYSELKTIKGLKFAM